MRINHNISSINTSRLLASNNKSTSGSLEKLSSGLAVNRAADNAAGLAISEKMRGQIRGLNQASDNANDGISLIQTAEGGLNETHSILQRMRELAVQSANDTNTDSDRKEIQKEVDQLTTEITRISKDTEFNTMSLLDGSLAAKIDGTPTYGGVATGVTVAAGANLTANGTYTITVSNFTAGTAVPASTVNATVANQGNLNTYGATAMTLTYNAASGEWGDGANTFTSAALAAKGITVTGTPQDGAKIEVSAYEAASTVTPTGPATNKPAGDTIYTYDGTSWKDAGGNAPDLTGVTMGTGWRSGDKIKIASADGAVTVESRAAATNAKLSVTQSKAVDGTPDTYDVAVTGPNGEAVSKTSFDLTGVAADGTITLDVSTANALTFHIGSNSGQNTKLTVSDMGAVALGVDAIDLTSQASSDASITTIDNAINKVSAQRAGLGAMQNRLEHTINNLGTSSENLSAAESQIRDVDMAEEMSNYTKNNILVQAATSMLAQANQQPQSVLSLLQG